MNRRQFVQGAAAAAAGLVGSACAHLNRPGAAAPRIPRWRGFNLTNKFDPRNQSRFRETDFQWISDWGFDFARLPLSYWCWSSPDDWYRIEERIIEEIDEAVAFGEKHSVHVNLNLHRIPGYCINGRDREPMDLFEGPEADRMAARQAAIHHWQMFARRYRGIPSRHLSFDLINEPPVMPVAGYEEVVRALVAAIRAEDPARLIVADGINVGRDPLPGVVDLGLVQSTRGYDPMQVSHYKASWVNSEGWERPTWPLVLSENNVWDRERLRQERIAPWMPLVEQGVQVHVGEWGVYQHTPHDVTLAYMEDFLSLWKEVGWGWALWNFHGPFGILDSGRDDVAYEDFQGHRLDRKMLALLQRY